MEKITLLKLSQDSVVLKKEQITVVDDTEYPIGEPWRKAYSNSEKNRAAVEAEVLEPYRTAIFAVWGDAPTVAD